MDLLSLVLTHSHPPPPSRCRCRCQVLGEEADTLRHTLAELGVRIGRDQVRKELLALLALLVLLVLLFPGLVEGW